MYVLFVCKKQLGYQHLLCFAEESHTGLERHEEEKRAAGTFCKLSHFVLQEIKSQNLHFFAERFL